jgi:hypothetical protein
VYFARRWWFSTARQVPLQIQNRILAGIPNLNFILAQNHAAVGHRYQPRIALAAPTRANLRSHKQLNWVTGYAANADWP